MKEKSVGSYILLINLHFTSTFLLVFFKMQRILSIFDGLSIKFSQYVGSFSNNFNNYVRTLSFQ